MTLNRAEMNYLVEAIEPKRGRERKAFVRQWLVVAESKEQAIDLAVADIVQMICNEKDNETTRRLVTDQIRAESTWTATLAGQVYRLRNQLR